MEEENFPPFNEKIREEWIGKTDGSLFDVAIIGGGITGAGVANILSQNGIRVILLEKNDFGSGTSSGSSKLIHGGLRYLAELRFNEVRTLLKERDYLVKNTGIVKYMNFKILIDPYSWKKSTMWPGLFVYNVLSRRFAFPRMVRNNGEFAGEVKGYYTYRDAFSDDCKLTLYNIISAVKHGAKCINYGEAISINGDENGVKITVNDKLRNNTFTVRSKVCINAAGPWSGEIYKKTGNPDQAKMKLSKGVHIVVPHEKAPVDDAIVFRSHIDKRQMFIIPRGEVAIIGTTDNFVESPGDFNVEKNDVDYIIESAQRFFKNLQASDITYSYAGIRPLYGDGDDPGSISRGFVLRHDKHFIHVFGGKLTDYRSAARKVAIVYQKISGRKMHIKNMPEIDYNRPDLNGEELYRYEIDHECALFPEDIIRRREAFDVYRKDRGASEINVINKLMERNKD